MKSTRSFVVALTRVLLLALAIAPIAEVAAANAAATSAYKKLTLSKEFYSEGAAFADFNKDGQLDVVSGPYWYEGPDFTKRHELFTPFVFDPLKYSDNFFAFTHDFNADGWPDVLVLDEADALKTLSSERTKAIFGVRCKMDDCLAMNVPYVWFLTGTPIRRYADDLYPVLQAFWPNMLKKYFGVSSLSGFQQQFCVTQMRRFHPRQPMKATVIGNKNEDQLRDFILPKKFSMILNRNKSIILMFVCMLGQVHLCLLK